jgi:hypothetical protein
LNANAESSYLCAALATTSSVGGFTPQKPTRKAYQQRPEAVQAWLANDYPALEQRAKSEGAEIHGGDETAVVNADLRDRCHVPASKTPVTFAACGTSQNLPMIPPTPIRARQVG